MTTKRLVLFPLIFCLLAACSRRPENVLSESEMTALIVDLELSDAACQIRSISPSFSPNAYVHYKTQVFDAHATTAEIFDRSLEWYTKEQPKKLLKIYGEAEKRLESMQGEE